jgi:phospholipase C
MASEWTDVGGFGCLISAQPAERSWFAAGFPMKNGKPTTCIPDPQLNQCDYPYHSTNLFGNGGPHGQPHSIVDVNHGKMDGFIRSAILGGDNYCLIHRTDPSCASSLGPHNTPDVLSYHNRHEIPNYWKYADDFVLQDHMFEAVDSWTLPSHLYLTSGWSADCSQQDDPMSCKSDSAMTATSHPATSTASATKCSWSPARSAS